MKSMTRLTLDLVSVFWQPSVQTLKYAPPASPHLHGRWARAEILARPADSRHGRKGIERVKYMTAEFAKSGPLSTPACPI